LNENAYFWIMKNTASTTAEPDWWDELTPEQQEELLVAIEESEDEDNLVSNEDAQAMFQLWLNKKPE